MTNHEVLISINVYKIHGFRLRISNLLRKSNKEVEKC